MNDVPLPLTPNGALPPLPLLLRWLEHLRSGADSAPTVTLPGVPHSNAGLPGLLRLGGVQRLLLNVLGAPARFRWESGGGRVVVASGDSESADSDELPLHHGPLPPDQWPDTSDDAAGLGNLLDLARLEDANAVVEGAEMTSASGGGTWDTLLAALASGQPPRVPPLAGHAAAETTLGAWNPLPFARRAVVTLNLGNQTAPWAVADATGARHPVQVIEGPLGREMLVSLPFGALECMPLTPFDDPVSGCWWEVSPTVLDNGRVRAELDQAGQIERLCFNGEFVDLAGALVSPMHAGMPLSSPAVVRVLEDGPVRSRIGVTRSDQRGLLHLTYTLNAHDDCLRISATWAGDPAGVTLDHPTTWRLAPVRVAAELESWDVPQNASVLAANAQPQHGCRWAAIGDGTRGLALVGGRAFALSAHEGRLRVPCTGTLSYALADAMRPTPGMSLGMLAAHLAAPARPFAGRMHMPAVLRLQGDGLTPWWVRRPAGWAGELALCAQAHRRCRALLQLHGVISEVARVDAVGRVLARVPPTPDGDGYVLDGFAGELLLVRWR